MAPTIDLTHEDPLPPEAKAALAEWEGHTPDPDDVAWLLATTLAQPDDQARRSG